MKPRQPAAQSSAGRQNRTERATAPSTFVGEGWAWAGAKPRSGGTAGRVRLARCGDQPQRSPIVLRRIDVYETMQIRIDRAQLPLPYYAHRHSFHNLRKARLA